MAAQINAWGCAFSFADATKNNFNMMNIQLNNDLFYFLRTIKNEFMAYILLNYSKVDLIWKSLYVVKQKLLDFGLM